MTHNKITTIFTATILISASSLFASSVYNITETEAMARSNPLDIFSSRGRSSAKVKRVKKQPRINKAEVATEKQTIYRKRAKQIYLTFDDGPTVGTYNIMKVLKEEGVDATMFFVGRHVQKNYAVFRKAISMPNILVANHTYSHADGKYHLFYSNTDNLIKDIDKAKKIIGSGKYLRFAGRNVWRLPTAYRNDYGISKKRRVIEEPAYNALANRGYQIYGWDVEWKQYDNAVAVAARIETKYSTLNTAKNGKVVLLAHDYSLKGRAGADSLRRLIRILHSRGWSFEMISSYTEEKKKLSPLDILRVKKSKLQQEDLNTTEITVASLSDDIEIRYKTDADKENQIINIHF